MGPAAAVRARGPARFGAGMQGPGSPSRAPFIVRSGTYAARSSASARSQCVVWSPGSPRSQSR